MFASPFPPDAANPGKRGRCHLQLVDGGDEPASESSWQAEWRNRPALACRDHLPPRAGEFAPGAHSVCVLGTGYSLADRHQRGELVPRIPEWLICAPRVTLAPHGSGAPVRRSGVAWTDTRVTVRNHRRSALVRKIRRSLESESGCLRCKRRGCFVCIFCAVDALSGQCLSRRPGESPLVGVVFRTKWLLREPCSATRQRRRRPGQLGIDRDGSG